MSRYWIGLTAVSIAMLNACATHTASPVANDRPIQPADPIAATDLLPGHQEWVRRYQLTVGEKAPQRIEIHLDQQSDSRWKQTLPDVRTTTLTSRADGARVIVQEEEMSDKVRVIYDPPLTLLPARLEMGQPAVGSVRMMVHNLEDGSIQEEGSCCYRVELLGRQKVKTPAGTFDAYIVRASRQIQLRLASAEVTIHTAYVPGQGVVAQQVDRTTRPLGLLNVHRTERLVLIEPLGTATSITPSTGSK